MEEQLEKYLLEHIDNEPAELARLDRDTHVRLLYSRMCSGHLQGRVLKMITRMVNPQLVLELGTYSGYSALCLAEGLSQPHATVHTIEIEDELEDFIREHLNQSPFGNRVTLHIGDAQQVLPSIEGDFDLAYIDANKRIYSELYEMVLTRVRHGGFIVVDNTLWDGKVANPHAKPDAQTEGIRRFNDLVANDPRVETVILPLRDGLTILHKL